MNETSGTPIGLRVTAFENQGNFRSDLDGINSSRKILICVKFSVIGSRKYMEDNIAVAYQLADNGSELEYTYFGLFDGCVTSGCYWILFSFALLTGYHQLRREAASTNSIRSFQARRRHCIALCQGPPNELYRQLPLILVGSRRGYTRGNKKGLPRLSYGDVEESW